MNQGIPDLKMSENENNKNVAKTNKEKAQFLSEFFSSVFTKETADDTPSIEPCEIQQPMPSLIITNKLVKNCLNNLKLNKSPGPDNLSPNFIKKLIDDLTEPLTIIFQNSYKTGIVPNQWKIAKITALFKKGNRSYVGNYRPVSLTSVIGKCMEQLIKEHVMKHMLTNNLISSKQYGFIPGRSTSLQLLKVLDEWTALIDEGISIDCIYMDFQKAFDKVPHNRLMAKLAAYKIEKKTLNWIKHFLNDRTQQVTIQGENSDFRDVTSGVPQGSILGPLLFVIYINDLAKTTNSSVFLYADDTKIFRPIKTEKDKEILREDLHKLQAWSDKWLLKFHPDKCKHLEIGQKNNQSQYKLNINSKDHILEKVTEEKDIGVLIDTKLSFENHISQKIKKANSIFSLIRRSFSDLNIKNFNPLFNSLVRSQLEYASSVWSPFKKKHIENIENVQRRATKQVPSLKNKTYEERLQTLQLPTLVYRRLRGDMIETYKILNNIYDKNASNFLKLKRSTNERHSQRGHALKLSHQRAIKEIRSHSFSVRVAGVWNSLPSNVVEAPNVNTFKNRLDRHWSSQDIKYNYQAALDVGLQSGLNENQELDTVAAQQQPESRRGPKVS